MKNLQEELKRMKSLMTEERLYGNLVNDSKKSLLTENWFSKLLRFLKNSKKSINLLTKKLGDEVIVAVKLGGDERYTALKNVFDKVNSGVYNIDSATFFKNLGIQGDKIEFYVMQYRKMQLILVKALADKHDIDMIAKQYRGDGLTEPVVKDMIDVVFPTNKEIRGLLGRVEDINVKTLLTKTEIVSKALKVRKNITYDILNSWDESRIKLITGSDDVIKVSDGSEITKSIQKIWFEGFWNHPAIKVAVVYPAKIGEFLLIRWRFVDWIPKQMFKNKKWFQNPVLQGITRVPGFAPLIIPVVMGFISLHKQKQWWPHSGEESQSLLDKEIDALKAFVIGFINNMPLIYLIKGVTKPFFDDIPENMLNNLNVILNELKIVPDGTQSCKDFFKENKEKIIKKGVEKASVDPLSMKFLPEFAKDFLGYSGVIDKDIIANSVEKYFEKAWEGQVCDPDFIKKHNLNFYESINPEEAAAQVVEEAEKIAEEAKNKVHVEVTKGEPCDLLKTKVDWVEILEEWMAQGICNWNDPPAVSLYKEEICKCKSGEVSELCYEAFDEVFNNRCGG